MTLEANESALMRRAIELSARGFPAPNPRVGAVVVSNGEVVGEGFHEAAGEAHAEVIAIRAAGERTRGSTLYVTLEPCSHLGRTPPCVDAILTAGIGRVVYAVPDPNPIASGGAHKLRAGNVTVESGLCEDEAKDANRVFLERHRLGRPYVLVKSAITLDGRIATEAGESRWITGPAARRRSHELRAEMGCVLVGANTAVKDDPKLTAREVGAKNQPLRVVLDPTGRVPARAAAFSGDAPSIRVVAEATNSAVEEVVVPAKGGELSLGALLQELARRDVIGVLVEGGGATIGSFIRQGFVDAVELHMAAIALGSGKGWLDLVAGKLADAFKIVDMKCEPLGEDLRISGRVVR